MNVNVAAPFFVTVPVLNSAAPSVASTFVVTVKPLLPASMNPPASEYPGVLNVIDETTGKPKTLTVPPLAPPKTASPPLGQATLFVPSYQSAVVVSQVPLPPAPFTPQLTVCACAGPSKKSGAKNNNDATIRAQEGAHKLPRRIVLHGTPLFLEESY